MTSQRRNFGGPDRRNNKESVQQPDRDHVIAMIRFNHPDWFIQAQSNASDEYIAELRAELKPVQSVETHGAFIAERSIGAGYWDRFLDQLRLAIHQRQDTEEYKTMMTRTEHSTDPDSHHWVSKREGNTGGEPAYVLYCACGKYYRDGKVVDR